MVGKKPPNPGGVAPVGLNPPSPQSILGHRYSHCLLFETKTGKHESHPLFGGLRLEQYFFEGGYLEHEGGLLVLLCAAAALCEPPCAAARSPAP